MRRYFKHKSKTNKSFFRVLYLFLIIIIIFMVAALFNNQPIKSFLSNFRPNTQKEILLDLSSGTHEFTIPVNDKNHGAIERIYLLHIPKDYSLKKNYPLVFVLHGTGRSASKVHNNFGFTELADQEDFIVVYPQALGLSKTQDEDYRDPKVSLLSRPTAWNTGRGEGYGTFNKVDDLAFFEAMLNMFTSQNFVDKDAIFITGISNGGGMAQKVVANFPGVFAGAGLVSTGIGLSDSDLENYEPIPMIIFHGTNDDLVPYYGDGEILPTPEKVDTLAELNNCSGQSKIEAVQTSEFNIELKTYLNCQAQVKLYTILEGGHRWYAQETEVIWEFFKNNKR